MDLLRMILIWLGIVDAETSGTMDNGSGSGGGNGSVHWSRPRADKR